MMITRPIGCSFFSVRQCEKDKGTLQAVAEMGCAGVEFFGFPKHGAQELLQMNLI